MKHKFLLFLTFAFLLTFCLPAPVAAAGDSIFYGDTIPAGMGSAWMAWRAATAKPQQVVRVEVKPATKAPRASVGKKRLPGKATG